MKIADSNIRLLQNYLSSTYGDNLVLREDTWYALLLAYLGLQRYNPKEIKRFCITTIRDIRYKHCKHNYLEPLSSFPYHYLFASTGDLIFKQPCCLSLTNQDLSLIQHDIETIRHISIVEAIHAAITEVTALHKGMGDTFANHHGTSLIAQYYHFIMDEKDSILQEFTTNRPNTAYTPALDYLMLIKKVHNPQTFMVISKLYYTYLHIFLTILRGSPLCSHRTELPFTPTLYSLINILYFDICIGVDSLGFPKARMLFYGGDTATAEHLIAEYYDTKETFPSSNCSKALLALYAYLIGNLKYQTTLYSAKTRLYEESLRTEYIRLYQYLQFVRSYIMRLPQYHDNNQDWELPLSELVTDTAQTNDLIYLSANIQQPLTLDSALYTPIAYKAGGLTAIDSAIGEYRKSIDGINYCNEMESFLNKWANLKALYYIQTNLQSDTHARKLSLPQEYYDFIQRHALPLGDTSIFGMLCAMIPNILLFDYLGITHTITKEYLDAIIVSFINTKKQYFDNIGDYTVDSMTFYITSLSYVSSVLTLMLTSNDTIGCDILATYFTLSHLLKYRFTCLPNFSTTKIKPIAIPSFTDDAVPLKAHLKKFFTVIIENAHGGNEAVALTAEGKYTKVLNYLANALVSGTVHAEYIVAMLITVDNDVTLKELNLVPYLQDVSTPHLIFDITRRLMENMHERRDMFYSFFNNPITIDESDAIYKTSTTTNPQKKQQTRIAEMEPYLESLTFITLLQRIALAIELMHEVNGKLQDDLQVYLQALRYIGGHGNPPCPEHSIKALYNITATNTLVLEDIKNAVQYIDAVTQELFTSEKIFSDINHSYEGDSL